MRTRCCPKGSRPWTGEYRFWLNHSDDDHEVAAAGTELLTGTALGGTLTVPASGVRVVASPVAF